MTTETFKTMTAEEQLYYASSTDRAGMLPKVVREGQLDQFSAIRIYHPQWMVNPDWASTLSPSDKFLLYRNPWAPLPTSPHERVEALEGLLVNNHMVPKDVQAAQIYLQTERKKLKKKTVAAIGGTTVKSETASHIDLAQKFNDEVAPMVMRIRYSSYNHEATIQNIRDARKADQDIVLVHETVTLSQQLRAQAEREFQNLKSKADFNENDWKKATIVSHISKIGELKNEIRGIESELSSGGLAEHSENWYKLSQQYDRKKRDLVHAVSNLVVLRFDEGDEDNKGNLYHLAEEYGLDYMSEYEKAEVELFLEESVKSIERQLKEAKKVAAKAADRLVELREQGRQVLRADARAQAGDDTSELAEFVNKESGQALYDYLHRIGLDIRRNAAKRKLLPHLIPNDPVRTKVIGQDSQYLNADDLFNMIWSQDRTFAEFARDTYFAGDKNKFAAYFWERFRMVLEDVLEVDIVKVAQDAQDMLIDNYLEDQAGDTELGVLGLEDQMRRDVVADLRDYYTTLQNVAITERHELLPQDEVEIALSRYLTLKSNFIDNPTSHEMLKQYISEAQLGIKPLTFVSLKCGRWITPNGVQDIVPTIGTYQTTNDKGAPVQRSRQTERANQLIHTQPFEELGPNFRVQVAVADTDIEMALGYAPDSQMRRHMDQYLDELSAITSSVPLSEIFVSNPTMQQLKQVHRSQLSAIVQTGTPREIKQAYFSSHEHYESTIDETSKAHASVQGWRRSPGSMSDAINEGLNPYRYVVEKYSDYAAWVQAMEISAINNNENIAIAVGGRDPITSLMARVQMGYIPIISIPHYSDYH